MGVTLGLPKPLLELVSPPSEDAPPVDEKPSSLPDDAEVLLPVSVAPPDGADDACEKGKGVVVAEAPASPVAAESDGPAVTAESVRKIQQRKGRLSQCNCRRAVRDNEPKEPVLGEGSPA